jgi:hypothetical protein
MAPISRTATAFWEKLDKLINQAADRISPSELVSILSGAAVGIMVSQIGERRSSQFFAKIASDLARQAESTTDIAEGVCLAPKPAA